jgi:phage gpG-like protein
MITSTVTGDKEFILKLASFPDKLRAELKTSMTSAMDRLKGHVQDDKLSGQVLNVRTGDLRASIAADVTDDTTSVTGKVSTDLPYSAIHEYGGTIPPHPINTLNSAAHRFMTGTSVMHPGCVIPERSYLRTSLRDMADSIRDELQLGVNRASQQ